MKQITKTVDRQEFLTHLWGKLKHDLEKQLPASEREDKMIILAWETIMHTLRHIYYAIIEEERE